MTALLNAEKLKRYRAIFRLLLKYGRSDLVQGPADDLAVQTEPAEGDPTPEELAADLEAMGPVYVKLGQVLASRADLLPQPYLDALARLHDNLEPIPAQTITETVEAELGVRISKAFESFDISPIATASLGQVHRASLRGGREVVVKVQRPNAHEQVSRDMEALADIAGLLDNHTDAGRRLKFGDVLDEFKSTLARELDYRQEANNLNALADNLAEFRNILVPRPVPDFCTARVITMDYVEGRKVTDLGPLARMEMDGGALAREVIQAYLKQILVDGFYHADPHPGNVFLTDDHRVALIDLGMVGHISPGMQDRVLKLILAISDGSADEAAERAMDLAARLEGYDANRFRQGVADLVMVSRTAPARDRRVGRAMLDLAALATRSGLRMPPDLSMLSKALLSLDEIARTLDPAVDPNEVIRDYSAEITRKRMVRDLTPGNLLGSVLEAREFAENLPRRVNQILDAVASNNLKIRVEAIDEKTVIEGFQKVANRIATGIVLAALIVGAALLMRVETSFRLFGYPGLAMLCFMAAAAGGFYMVISTLLNDRRSNRRVEAVEEQARR